MSTTAPAEPVAKRARFISILDGIRPYRREWLSKDIVAGITLAALAIPEVMGYTKIAGTPVITGLYTILHPDRGVRGSSARRATSSSAATRRPPRSCTPGSPGSGSPACSPNTPQWVAFASLSALITAGLLLLARLARLGFLADFLSRTVLVGFLTGVGIQVAMGQVGGHARHSRAGRCSGRAQRHRAQVRADTLAHRLRRRGRRPSCRPRSSQS